MDNYFQNCPPVMMQDGGRELGDFKTATRRNEYIKYINGMWRDDQYRVFLQSNGREIQNREWDWYSKGNRCREQGCVHIYPTLSTTEQYVEERKLAEAQLQRPRKSCKMPCAKFDDYRLNSDLKPRV